MKAIQTYQQTAITSNHKFSDLVNVTLQTVADSSARIYRQTFKLWETWAIEAGLSPFEMTPGNVSDFLASQGVTKPTKQRQLSALRKLTEMLSILDYSEPKWAALHAGLKKIKISNGQSGKERDRRALAPKQVWQVLNACDGDKLVCQRNRALLAVMFYVGARRAEIAALKWSDVNLEDKIVRIRHGKGDKEREATIIGETAVEALQAWKLAQFEAAGERVYVFGAMGKGDRFLADKPMTTNAIWKAVKVVGDRAGVEFSPHDARRTLATDLLMNNSPIADVQAQLGHEREATTLRYARPANAKERRFRLKTGY